MSEKERTDQARMLCEKTLQIYLENDRKYVVPQ